MKSHRRHWTQWLKSNCGISLTCRNPSVWGWCNKCTWRNQWNWCSAMWAKVRNRRLKLLTLDTAAAQAKPFPPRQETGRRSPLFFNFQHLCNVFIYNWTAFYFHSAPGTARLLRESCWKFLKFHDSNSVMYSRMCVNMSCCGMQSHIRYITSLWVLLICLSVTTQNWKQRWTRGTAECIASAIICIESLRPCSLSMLLDVQSAYWPWQPELDLSHPASSWPRVFFSFVFFFFTFVKREVSTILDIIIMIWFF